MTRCVKCEVLETINGVLIQREEDRKFDLVTGEAKGHIKVFYTVGDEENTYECFKTLAEARRYAMEY